ncbi:MAG: histidinol-phosphate transaminase [Gammaproteobacteria bacterium]|nr:histidinol-phosphate transaminase [Gammaproteobacteria bacterium]
MSATDPRDLLNPHVANIDAYKPIAPLEVLSERLGIAIEDLVKLDANENPYGPVPAVSEALANYPFFHIYPDPQQGELRAGLAAAMGISAENVLASHGADELLDYLARLFLRPGDAVINTPPTFGMYGFDAKLQGADVINVTRDAVFDVDVDGIRAAVDEANGRAKLLFLTSPNNPSGTWLSDEKLTALLELPIMVVLDEAYVEFADGMSRASWVAGPGDTKRDNMIVLRTFSKAAGIAGLRLGYGIFPDWLMPVLWKYKQPYNVNVAASVAGLASLSQPEQMRDVVAKLTAERARLYEQLESAPQLEPVTGSQANFILCKVVGRDALALKEALERRGILVRHYTSAGLENCIRISVGRPDQTDALMAALRALN